jgi:hypothetical protein
MYWAISLKQSAAIALTLLFLLCSRDTLDHLNCYPGGSLGTPQFKVVTSTVNQLHLVQFALRLKF